MKSSARSDSPSAPATSPEIRVLRECLSTDSLPLQQLAAKCPEAAQWTPESYERLSESGFRGWLVETHGALQGFLIARLASDQAEILNLAVDPSLRRAGLASGLLGKAIDAFRKAGVTSIYLEVRRSNDAAVAFYKAHGFAKTGERKNYYQSPTEHATTMEKKLTD
jgi:ribosomal-protein-alanine acetyltransferase